MTPKVQPFVAQLTTDDADVFAANFGAQVPVWFKPRILRIQVVFSDTDALHSLRIAGVELGRNSGPHISGADNVQGPDWRAPHYVVPVPEGVTDFDILLDHNAVTAGAGMAVGQWEG
jgi:hypothetical protein